MNYFPLHIGDYLRDAAHLSNHEHGIYFRILITYYRDEGPKTADQFARAVAARSPEERQMVDDILQEFFQEQGCGLWHHKRCDREIQIARDKASRAAENGGKGGRPSKPNGKPEETKTEPNHNPEKTSGFSDENQTETKTEPNSRFQKPREKLPNSQEPIANNQEPKASQPAARGDHWADQFLDLFMDPDSGIPACSRCARNCLDTALLSGFRLALEKIEPYVVNAPDWPGWDDFLRRMVEWLRTDKSLGKNSVFSITPAMLLRDRFNRYMLTIDPKAAKKANAEGIDWDAIAKAGDAA